MSAKPSPTERRRRELLTQITQIGHVLPGSLNTVMNRCGKPRCACHAEPPRLHGPYITWTRKAAGKTQTRRLTPEQADRYRPWLENNRRLRELLSELEALSLKAAQDAEGWGEKQRSRSAERVLNVLTLCGLMSRADQIRCTVAALTPLALAIERQLQCVSPGGFSCSVACHDRGDLLGTDPRLSPAARPHPAQPSPFRPSHAKRSRHALPVVGETPTAATAAPITVFADHGVRPAVGGE